MLWDVVECCGVLWSVVKGCGKIKMVKSGVKCLKKFLVFWGLVDAMRMQMLERKVVGCNRNK